MGEYKFRGKPTDNNTTYFEDEEFVYGSLVIDNGKYYIVLGVNDNINRDDYEVYMVEVIPETVGQYTGLKDKNGKEIYEGDIVYCQTKYGKAKAIIKFIDGKFVAYWDSKITHPKNGHHIACYDINKRFEVIGNIYDNKELLNETDR